MLSVERVKPAYVQVAGQLQDLIVRGRLTAGQRLPVEAELSTMFGVSRSTIREALRLLSSQNLVETRRGVHGGTFVAAPDTTLMGGMLETGLGLLSGADLVSVDQMIEACDLLEVPAARLAAERRTPEQLEQIRQAAAVADKFDDPIERYEGGGNGFHSAILAACGNPLLNLVATPIFTVLRTRFHRTNVAQDFWDRSSEQHHAIYHAIELGDSQRAGDLMRMHLAELRALCPGGAHGPDAAHGEADEPTASAGGAAVDLGALVEAAAESERARDPRAVPTGG
jgi:DNA-binding FadR family transcriptional regulator